MGAQGFSEVHSALALLALTTPMLVFPAIAAWLTRWFSAGKVAVFGLLVATAGLIGMAQAIAAADLPRLSVMMFVTGAGAALPWGLMDGLAVAAVAVERAGMAAGLFNTVRVAGEGMALAVVMALLTLLNRLELQHKLPTLDATTRDAVANWLSGSHVVEASKLLPSLSINSLMLNVQHAYQILLYGLALITLICAGLIGFLLTRPAAQR